MSDRAPQDAGQALTIHGVSADPSITFSPGGKTVLTITPDGRFVLGEGATVDDAAKAICEIATRIMRPPFTREDVRICRAMAEQVRVTETRHPNLPTTADKTPYWDSLAARINSLLPPEHP